MFESLSASVLYSDGMLNVDRLVALRKRIESALASYTPVVKYVKGTKEFPVRANIILPVSTLKEARAVLKTLQADQKAEITEPKVGGEKGKFILTFLAVSAKAAQAAYKVVTQSPGLTPAPAFYYVASKKAKTTKMSAAKDKANDVKYLRARAVKVAERKKLSDAVVALLPVFDKGVLPQFDADIRAAVTEIKKHMAKAEVTRRRIEKVSAENRSQRQAAYAELVDEVQALFGDKIKPQNIVMGTSIAGQTMYVKLPSGKIMTVSISTPQNFNKARKSQAEAE